MESANPEGVKGMVKDSFKPVLNQFIGYFK